MTATRNKRILSVQPVSDGGGSEHALIGMLGELAADGWDCHVAVPEPARMAAEYAAAGATLHVVPMANLTTSGRHGRWLRFAARWPWTVLRLARLVRRLDAGLVHSNSLHSWYGWAAAALTGRPHVWHAREIVFQSRAALALERFLTRRFAARVIAVSDAVAAQLHPDNVVVLRCGSDKRAISWVRQQGAGRVFYTTLGHDNHSWTMPPLVDDHVIPGLLWSMGR